MTFDAIPSGAKIHGEQVDLSYKISRYDSVDKHTEHKRYYSDSGLAVGDTVTHGPVTIEVVAIHDAVLSRNDAVDLRVTFDEDRLDEAP